MNNLFRTKVHSLALVIIDTIIAFAFSLKRTGKHSKKILIVRLDSIGDYILTRNFFRVLKEDERFQNHEFTLCGNLLWKDLAEHYDQEFFKEFIWVDRKEFRNKIKYRYNLFKHIYYSRFEVVIEPTYSREILFGDSIVKMSKAKTRIGSTGSKDGSAIWKRNLFSDAYYTNLIESKGENIFEFYRNKDFFEKLMEKKLEITRTSLDVSSIRYKPPTNESYIVISPGAQFRNRIWKIENFIEIINSILIEYNFDIIITGSPQEKYIAGRIIENISSGRLINLAGKTSLVELAKLISCAKLIIANESMGVHVAAAVNTPFICISTGQHFGRFSPYPEEIFENGYYIYPVEIRERLFDFDKLAEEFRYEAVLDINSIEPGLVLEKVKQVIREMDLE